MDAGKPPESPKPSRAELQAALDLINRETLTITEAAAQEGVSAQAFWRRIREGRVPAITVAGALRVWRGDVPTTAAS